MRSPVDKVKGRIVGYNPRDGTMTIRAIYRDWRMYLKRGYQTCEILLEDGRIISDQQRKSIYAMIREIADYTGMSVSEAKEAMKAKYLESDLEGELDGFSLKDCSVSVAAGFQRFLVRFMIDFNVPAGTSLLQYADDQADYLYSCLMNRRCCICGKPSDLHHLDAVGMGRNRREIVHEGMRVLPLCRIHHTEIHSTGKLTFMKKYHIDKGLVLDRFLCQLYGLNTREG